MGQWKVLLEQLQILNGIMKTIILLLDFGAYALFKVDNSVVLKSST